MSLTLFRVALRGADTEGEPGPDPAPAPTADPSDGERRPDTLDDDDDDDDDDDAVDADAAMAVAVAAATPPLLTAPASSATFFHALTHSRARPATSAFECSRSLAARMPALVFCADMWRERGKGRRVVE
jgi:hypothetical protein